MKKIKFYSAILPDYIKDTWNVLYEECINDCIQKYPDLIIKQIPEPLIFIFSDKSAQIRFNIIIDNNCISSCILNLKETEYKVKYKNGH